MSHLYKRKLLVSLVLGCVFAAMSIATTGSVASAQPSGDSGGDQLKVFDSGTESAGASRADVAAQSNVMGKYGDCLVESITRFGDAGQFGWVVFTDANNQIHTAIVFWDGFLPLRKKLERAVVSRREVDIRMNRNGQIVYVKDYPRKGDAP